MVLSTVGDIVKSMDIGEYGLYVSMVNWVMIVAGDRGYSLFKEIDTIDRPLKIVLWECCSSVIRSYHEARNLDVYILL